MKLGTYLRDPSLLARKLRWRLLYDGPRRDVTVDTWNGRLTFDSRDKLIGKYLYVQGAYERRWLEQAVDVLRGAGALPPEGGGTLLDIGANIGMIGIALLRQGWFDRVVAVEPAPENLRLLRQNLAQNGVDARATVLPIALSAQDGEMALELSDYNSGDNRLRVLDTAGAFHEQTRPVVTVPVRTLDRALVDAAVDPADVRLVWIDVQGHEAQVFAGGRRLIARGVPVVTEFWPYGIRRSGMTRDAYLRAVAEPFTHFWHLRDGGAERQPIAALDALFDALAAPKQMAELILVRER